MATMEQKRMKLKKALQKAQKKAGVKSVSFYPNKYMKEDRGPFTKKGQRLTGGGNKIYLRGL